MVCRVSFRGGRGGAFAPPRLTLAPPWNWQICMLREPCPPTKLHIAVLPPLGPNPERNTGMRQKECNKHGAAALENMVELVPFFSHQKCCTLMAKAPHFDGHAAVFRLLPDCGTFCRENVVCSPNCGTFAKKAPQFLSRHFPHKS